MEEEVSHDLRDFLDLQSSQTGYKYPAIFIMSSSISFGIESP